METVGRDTKGKRRKKNNHSVKRKRKSRVVQNLYISLTNICSLVLHEKTDKTLNVFVQCRDKNEGIYGNLNLIILLGFYYGYI